jgi:hypothetical protein
LRRPMKTYSAIYGKDRGEHAPLLERAEWQARRAVGRVAVVATRVQIRPRKADQLVVGSEEELAQAVHKVTLSLGIHNLLLLRVEEHLQHRGGALRAGYMMKEMAVSSCVRCSR